MNQLLGALRAVTNEDEEAAEESRAENVPTTTQMVAPTARKCNAISLRPAAPKTSSFRYHTSLSSTEQLSSSTVESVFSEQDLSNVKPTTSFVQKVNNSSSGRVSPRLNYGLWVEPDWGLPIVIPPKDIIPYLNGAESSFVTKLYWRTLMLALSLLRGQRRRHRNLTPDAAFLTQRIFGKSLQYDTGEVIAATIHARLGFRLKGQIEASHPGRDPVNALRLYDMIQSDLSMRGETMDHWLDARQVEQLIGDVFGLDSVMLLQAASLETADAATIERTTRLVEGLARHSVCFGDGPRYALQDVTIILHRVFNERPEVVRRVDTFY